MNVAVPIKHYISTKNSDRFPVGMLVPIAGPAPEPWVECDGRLLPVADYPDLFSVIGYTWAPKTLTFAKPFAKVRKFFGMQSTRTVPNPDAPPEGFFRIPDMVLVPV